jgi:hypothetical protein
MPPPLTTRPTNLAKSDEKFWDKRDELLKKMDGVSLNWVSVNLSWVDDSKVTHTGKIKVCSPVFVQAADTQTGLLRFYSVPVTAAETYWFARHFKAYPLTRSVVRQVHYQTTLQIGRPALDASKPGEGYDLDTSSRFYTSHYYAHNVPNQIVSGGHKLWILSAVKTSINHGFYVKTAPGAGTFQVLNNLGAFHDENHWDYSQLLQLMKDLTDNNGQPMKDSTGATLTLLQALKDKHKAIWDEPRPWIGFTKGQDGRLYGGASPSK